MPLPSLLFVVGTRSEALACATLMEAFRAIPRSDQLFSIHLLSTGQEDTELLQVCDTLEIDLDWDLGLKTPHQADAIFGARVLREMETALRQRKPVAVVLAGYSATAWATAISAWYRGIPVVHVGAGLFAADESQRPFPEWLHAHELARLAELHLCAGKVEAEALGRILEPPQASTTPTPRIMVTGSGADEILDRSLAHMPDHEDPTLTGFRLDAPRVLACVRRREHHANALRPLCRAMDALSVRHPDADFAVIHSLQSHICDALAALLPRRDNVLGISPLPHPVLVRQLSRARLVVTDSAGLAREALLLGRPTIMIGAYAVTNAMQALADASSAHFAVTPMEAESLEAAIDAVLAEPEPAAAPQSIDAPPAGERAKDAILAWWGERNA
jgi:UDP-N-acetylglucosamine 2-epimerase (non-hydrolysing)